MTKRIFRSILLTAVLAVLLASWMLFSTLYSVYEQRIVAGLRTEALCIAEALEHVPDELEYLQDLELESRVTLISANGAVRYDSRADVILLDSHESRPEVAQALMAGMGESRRYSDTLSEMSIYHALRTGNGDVLRVGVTVSSSLGMMMDIAPQVAVVLILLILMSLVIARVLSSSIVEPVNQLNLDAPLENEVYEELAPLLNRMEQQNLQIQRHVRALSRAHGELRAIIDNMREGLILLDRHGEIMAINGSAATLFGISAASAQGSAFGRITDQPELNSLVSDALQGLSGDALYPRDRNTYRVYASPVYREERTHGAVLLILDVTERFAAEASRREFTANVSHELKTPLTTISGFAEIIRDGIARAEDAPAFAGRIHKEAQRLLALVNDILALSRLDEKQGLGDKEPVSLQTMLSQLLADFLPRADEKQIRLSLEGSDCLVEGYPLMLRELFHNLIDNAIKYTPRQGSVTVTLLQMNGRAACRVSDTGVGIPHEHQARVFERFYRVDKSHSRQTGGTGLGLAIVKHVAEAHHAELTLVSTPGQGTAVTVRF